MLLEELHIGPTNQMPDFGLRLYFQAIRTIFENTLVLQLRGKIRDARLAHFLFQKYCFNLEKNLIR